MIGSAPPNDSKIGMDLMRTALTSLVLIMIATAKAIGAESSGTETMGKAILKNHYARCHSIAVGADRAVIVEAVGLLSVAADQGSHARSASGRFIAWCKQEQASIQRQLELMEAGKVLTREIVDLAGSTPPQNR